MAIRHRGPALDLGAPAARGPTAVTLPRGSAGLPRESVALCHQITTLDREKLHQHVGTLPSVAVAAIADGLKAAMALD